MTTLQTATLPATLADDGFDSAPSETTRVVGQFLKFVKDGWFISNESQRINGTELVVYDYTRCWQKWHDSRIVATILPEPGVRFPVSVDDIDDTDDRPGEWQEARYLYLSHLEDGRDFTYGTSSAGGTQVVDSLAQQVNRMRRRKPGAYPVVKLDATTYQHRLYGIVDKPTLPILRWVDQHGQPYPMMPIATAGVLVEQPKIRPPMNDLDDEIPF